MQLQEAFHIQSTPPSVSEQLHNSSIVEAFLYRPGSVSAETGPMSGILKWSEIPTLLPFLFSFTTYTIMEFIDQLKEYL